MIIDVYIYISVHMHSFLWILINACNACNLQVHAIAIIDS